MRACALLYLFREWSMAFALFRKRQPEPAAPAVEPTPVGPAIAADASGGSDNDSAREILELLELELGAMIRQLERAANSVAGGAEATAATLSTIRQRTDALTGHTSAAQTTATTFSQVADKFTQSAEGIGSQVRDAGKLADQASAAAREASANVERLRESSAAIGNAASTSRFIVSVGDSASEINSVPKEAESHGESVAKAGQAVTMFAQKLKSRCAVLLRQNEGADRRKREKLPCSLRIEMTTSRGVVTAPVYEISNDGVLISGPDAERLVPHETLAATLQNVGA